MHPISTNDLRSTRLWPDNSCILDDWQTLQLKFVIGVTAPFPGELSDLSMSSATVSLPVKEVKSAACVRLTPLLTNMSSMLPMFDHTSVIYLETARAHRSSPDVGAAQGRQRVRHLAVSAAVGRSVDRAGQPTSRHPHQLHRQQPLFELVCFAVIVVR